MKNRKLNTTTIKAGTFLRFERKGFIYGLFTIVENLDRFILLRPESEISPPLEEGENLEMSLCSGKAGAYLWKCSVLGRIHDSEGSLIAVSHCSEAEWRPDKGCITTHAHLPFVFFSFNPSDEGKMFQSTAPSFQQATILEMTDREAVLETSGKAEGKIFRGHIKIGDKTIDLAGKATEEASGKYRLQILSLENRDRKMLLNYIYRTCSP